jgi:lipopolysaccharide transport protein LptA
MKRLQKQLIIMCVVAAGAALSVAAAGEAEGGSAVEAVTVITSEKLTFDYKKQYALFENNVLATDPEMQLAADKLTVIFDAKGKAQSIKAEGRVTIKQTDKTAQAGLATYDFETGKIVLAIKPRVTRGRDTLEGELITFWRDQNRMICQPQARLVIYPEKGGVKDQLFGE